ncbi:hypothetical protein CFR73_09820 [Novacetimonas maltaceti]|uniref:Tail fiber protein n=1 Tax=Novacetimonas maltaceti TaxID=1203393 RepID=A0A2S3W3Z4_9PROT|nr:hypothetical protein [Novacetimonas maltaceti]POF63605.1 hypothetical protein KMAL_07850 [Novacetimonas maltaceti]PYD59873.1 hypothetical protein CFR73_09820 [Novacetimonas maltaceti]
MKQGSFPAKFALPFASGAGAAYIRAIPQASQVGVTAGAASLADGFPPVTFDPVSAGGTPPSGADMNGILNWVTSVLQAYQSGYLGAWDSTFATAIGGYPMNAIVSGVAAGTYYVSTTDDNMTTPGAAGAAWQSLFAGLQVALGFTPVQQGGGTQQGGNKIYLGWGQGTYAGRLAYQVDGTDKGPLANHSDVTDEVTRATTAENTLSAFLVGEISRAQQAEGVLSNSLTGEIARAEAAEARLVSGVGDPTQSDAQVTVLAYRPSWGTAFISYDGGILIFASQPQLQATNANLAAESTARANEVAALTANFANYVPLTGNVTIGGAIDFSGTVGFNYNVPNGGWTKYYYGGGNAYSFALQEDGNAVFYDASGNAMFSVGGSPGAIDLQLPVSGNVRSGTVSGGTFSVINGVMRLAFTVNTTTATPTITFPIAFASAPSVVAMLANTNTTGGVSAWCNLHSAPTATGVTLFTRSAAGGVDYDAYGLVQVIAEGPV